MAKRKLNDEDILVVEGDYFSAKYDGVKIRGIVSSDGGYPEILSLDNAQAGEEDCDADFPYKIELAEGALGTEQDLFNAGVTNYVVIKDRKQKAVIDKDILPEFDYQWKVKVSGDVFTFGCGAVKLTRKQLEAFLRFRTKFDVEYMNVIGNESVEDSSVSELKEYIKYQEAKNTADGKLFNEVVEAAGDNDVEIDQLMEYSDAEIKELFKYADHVNNS